MTLSREQKYRKLNQASAQELDQLQQKVAHCAWRQSYHIQPPYGLLNDPNGFSFYEGEYHLFYQWFPLGTFHGMKYWYHTKSKDLAHWQNVGIGIEPGDSQDSHGAYSGSGIVKDGELYLMYTGNTRNEAWVRLPYQNLAVMNSEGNIHKRSEPVIASVPDGYTEHFRDPKVWRAGDDYYCVIGAQRTNETGCAVMYKSQDLLSWSFLGEVSTQLNNFGYMWECPDYFELDHQGVLLFCPQGLVPEGDRYQNIYQSGYVVGKRLDVNTQMLDHGAFRELDRGFDFYAPQTTEAPDGRRILVAWMGLPDVSYPTDQHGWAHCLTLPRELTLREGKIIQRPVQELEKRRKDEVNAEAVLHSEAKSFSGFQGSAYELICEFNEADADRFGIEFRVGSTEKTVLTYDRNIKKVILDRSLSGQSVNSEFGSERRCSLDADTIKFHLFVDTSSVEIFVNDGEEVFTSRIFPSKESTQIRFFAHGGSAACRASLWQIS
ncbi:glycoside hydrolase family 32 protein [Paenibacillus lentus]|uniref:Sucrose-6-phosphate hydrolase n=1 Tax=Paenibacillus lentus TaxID=1338368 RepID=A0A3Q8SCJ0_9BACL|nr:sucrose-6-phosphate hydrolase [Paenibacillus lentus]AZK47474.1 sucrose-6-phosphate hydrolase [Paenibacillus lentus]